MTVDRRLILNNVSEEYWKKLKKIIGDRKVFVTVAPFSETNYHIVDIPFSLLGTHNYAALFDAVSGYGYSVTLPRGSAYINEKPYWWFGLYTLKQKKIILNERPNLLIIEVISFNPLEVVLKERDRPDRDISYLIRDALSK